MRSTSHELGRAEQGWTPIVRVEITGNERRFRPAVQFAEPDAIAVTTHLYPETFKEYTKARAHAIEFRDESVDQYRRIVAQRHYAAQHFAATAHPWGSLASMYPQYGYAPHAAPYAAAGSHPMHIPMHSHASSPYGSYGSYGSHGSLASSGSNGPAYG